MRANSRGSIKVSFEDSKQPQTSLNRLLRPLAHPFLYHTVPLEVPLIEVLPKEKEGLRPRDLSTD